MPELVKIPKFSICALDVYVDMGPWRFADEAKREELAQWMSDTLAKLRAEDDRIREERNQLFLESLRHA